MSHCLFYSKVSEALSVRFNFAFWRVGEPIRSPVLYAVHADYVEHLEDATQDMTDTCVKTM